MVQRPIVAGKAAYVDQALPMEAGILHAVHAAYVDQALHMEAAAGILQAVPMASIVMNMPSMSVLLRLQL